MATALRVYPSLTKPTVKQVACDWWLSTISSALISSEILLKDSGGILPRLLWTFSVAGQYDSILVSSAVQLTCLELASSEIAVALRMRRVDETQYRNEKTTFLGSNEPINATDSIRFTPYTLIMNLL